MTNPIIALRLVPRKGECLDCGDAKLECPSCPSGQSCQYTVPTDCTQECAQAVCVSTGGSPSEDDGGSKGGNNDDGGDGPNVGAIAGGVIGGVIVIAILTYLAWRFLIKPKRAEEAARQSTYTAGGATSHDTEKDGGSRLTRRDSTHTVHSIASTVLTRASNIIQIAYIPGVTNRANQSQSNVLVPPVPPIPMQHSGQNNGGPGNDDQHFFVPGDLRDSTYSGLSGYTDRTSYATRTSYAPRSSIASTIYGKQAQVMTPASTGLRAKPTMVSVKSVGNGSGGSTPPVPSIDFEKFGNGRPKSGASTFSVGSTFLNTATQARAQVVKVGGGLKQVEIPAKSEGNSTKGTPTLLTPDSANRDTASPSSLSGETAVTSPPTVIVTESPFSDPPDGQATPTTPGLKAVSTPTLGAVMEVDAEEEHTGIEKPKPTATERATSPFGDEHATK